MPVHVAFLRAINVGGRRVSMERLRAPFEDLGLEEIATFIASGNVIFRSSRKGGDLEDAIEVALEEALGFEVATFVRSSSRLARLVDDQPFGSNGDLVHVGLLKRTPPAARKSALEAMTTKTDEVTARGRQIYWLARGGVGRATVSGAALENAVGQAATFRSLKMLRRLNDKLAAG
jgi:uncharacterized protein (DUF1697 family)